MRVAGSLALVLLITVSVSGAVEPGDRDAITSFLATRPFERPFERDYALDEMKRLDGFAFLDQFHDVRFYVYPTGASSLAGHVALAVDDRGRTFAVGQEGEFNRLIRTLGRVVSEPGDAEALARDFLRLARIHAEVWEGVHGGLNFIRSIEDIPFDASDIEQEIERFDVMLNHPIEPAVTERTCVGFEFRGFSWAPFDGSLMEHVVSIHADGTLQHHQEILAYPYGDYSRGGCVVPLDSGPGVDVMARLARQGDTPARMATARYIAVLAGSTFILHQWLMEKHRPELVDVARGLTLDTDPAVRLAGVEALTALDRDGAKRITPPQQGNDPAPSRRD